MYGKWKRWHIRLVKISNKNLQLKLKTNTPPPILMKINRHWCKRTVTNAKWRWNRNTFDNDKINQVRIGILVKLPGRCTEKHPRLYETGFLTLQGSIPGYRNPFFLFSHCSRGKDIQWCIVEVWQFLVC